MPLLIADNVTKRFEGGVAPVEALKGVNLSIEAGELLGIYGASGSGKSTLLHLLGGIDEPTSGAIFVEGKRLSSLSDDDKATFRNRTIGFVFQFYHLLPELTALENAMLPLLISGVSRTEAEKRASQELQTIGLAARQDHLPSELSGGEQQRVAIIRASIMEPRLILADEPTGNLDRQNGEQVWNHLLELHVRKKSALVIVTHNRELLKLLPHSMELRDGKLQEGMLS